MTTVNATLVANYAIYYENRKLWEAKGNVVVTKSDGTKLYTQQLFWNSITKRIYSNVDTKVVTDTDTFIGEGFESDEELKDLHFRRFKSKMRVDTAMQTEGRDSVKTESQPSATDGGKGEPEASGNDKGKTADGQSDKAVGSEKVRSESPAPKRERRNDRMRNGNSRASEPFGDAKPDMKDAVATPKIDAMPDVDAMPAKKVSAVVPMEVKQMTNAVEPRIVGAEE